MTFYYLATPYSKYPWGLEEAYRFACRQAAMLAQANVPVFSPIAFTHGIAIHGGISPMNHEFWMKFDEPFMAMAHSLIVVKAPTWEASRGIAVEVATFVESGKPVIYMEPDRMPAELL